LLCRLHLPKAKLQDAKMDVPLARGLCRGLSRGSFLSVFANGQVSLVDRPNFPHLLGLICNIQPRVQPSRIMNGNLQ
jgi:hypothetical protein